MEEIKQKQAKEYYEEHLIVGAKIKLGEQYVKKYCSSDFNAGDIITLIEGRFEFDNGLYCSDQIAPAIWNACEEDYDSIYHLFGNNFEYFLDCEILNK